MEIVSALVKVISAFPPTASLVERRRVEKELQNNERAILTKQQEMEALELTIASSVIGLVDNPTKALIIQRARQAPARELKLLRQKRQFILERASLLKS